MGWMAPRGSVGTALDASEAASGKSAPPPPSSVRVSRCSSPTPGTATHSGGGSRAGGGDPSRIPPVLRTQRQACKGETPHTVNI